MAGESLVPERPLLRAEERVVDLLALDAELMGIYERCTFFRTL